MTLEQELETNINLNEHFKHIPYKEKILRAYTELRETDPNKVMKRGWEERDKALGGIYWWKIYVVGADTWVGKSTFVNQVCNNVSNQWWKVIKYSLEDRMEDIWKEELYYVANRLRFKDSKPAYERVKFVNNEYNDDEFRNYVDRAGEVLVDKTNLTELDKTKQVWIDELVMLMEQECLKGAKLFAIDHLHYFEMSWEWRHDLQIQNVMHQLNEIARQYDVAVFIVAHYVKNKAFGLSDIPSYDDFKDGSAIKQVANIIIQITRDITAPEEESMFHITKMRWPIKPTQFTTTFNMELFEYAFKKSFSQEAAEDDEIF